MLSFSYNFQNVLTALQTTRMLYLWRHRTSLEQFPWSLSEFTIQTNSQLQQDNSKPYRGKNIWRGNIVLSPLCGNTSGFNMHYDDEGKNMVNKQTTVCKHCITAVCYMNEHTSNIMSHLLGHHPAASLAGGGRRVNSCAQPTLTAAFQQQFARNNAVSLGDVPVYCRRVIREK